MGIVVVMLVIIVGAGWFVWKRRRYGQASTASVPPPGVSHKHLAFKSFAHGNTLLRAGKFDEASAAFHQTRALEPNHPHVADRLAEVERQQQATPAVAPAGATC
jgi:Tfp pilus assembly protein PilF